MKYVCELCGYLYKPENGDPENDVQPGTDFEDIPAEWCCPLCGAMKEDFEPISSSDYDVSEF
ncbi:MAG: rubredoxin [Clostridia bacterium]|nr:rubredoxin [Clostridia bacterium]